MKHAANRTKPTIKAKAKTLNQVETVKKIKPAAKQSFSKTALKPRSLKPLQKARAAAKTAPKDLPRAAKPTAKQIVPKLSAKTSNTLQALSVRKAKPAAEQPAQPKAKKVELKTAVKTNKVSIKKVKPVASIKKVGAIAKTVKKLAAPKKAKLKIALAKPKVPLKTSAKSLVKPAKSQPSKLAVQKTKQRPSKVEITASAAKIKSARQKSKPVVAAKKLKNTGKTKPIAAARPVEQKKIAPIAPTKPANLQSKKIQRAVPAKKTARKAEEHKEAEKIKLLAAAKKVVRRTQKLKPAISAATFGKPNRKTKKVVPVEKSAALTNAIEARQAPAPKPKNRKARPISSAVFRGKKERYDFKVFELSEKFEPIPAVYIISKRKTDRNKRGHHALICIGETASISDELKRHRRGKCVKKHEANVVSILPEADEKMRLKIETDLKAAHAVVCNLD